MPPGPPPRLVVSLIALVLVVSACGGDAGDRVSPEGSAAVTVAAFGFSESRLLAELYAQAMEARDIPVQRALDLASREVVEPALEQGVVDFVPEYAGTALEFLNKGAGQATADSDRTYQFLRQALSFRGITTLDRAPAQNQNALAVTRATAHAYGLTRVSDLVPVAARLSFGGPPECPERRFCLPGLSASYGLTFKTFLPLDAAGPLTVGALEGAEVDVGLLFTTSPVLAVKDLVLLVDDRQLQPAENVVPVVRNDVLARYGDRLRQAVNAVSAALTTDELIQLNKAVDLDGVNPSQVARAWLDARDLGD